MSPSYGAFASFSRKSLPMLVTMPNKALHRIHVIQAVIDNSLRVQEI